MKRVKIRKIGNSYGVLLPKDLLEMLHATEGDELVFERDEAGVRVKVTDPGTDEMLQTAEDTMERRFNVLRALSK
ncbi:MAG: AbrB/MazE/SpoVT family DNA-binding domain-containing protein [Ponticaulis sp.]|nr:AbrB/MazE/SpoVT family DNA-binding domain-containing protein [Ponticaulis sp.]|tara:strand:- start:430 stop:654 length:225 start_codon:yes stop_codon:yes gene_type:complete